MIGETLKELRARAGITQSEMANRMGMSLRGYQDLEGGATPMRELHRLAVSAASEALAIERGDPMLATDEARARALALYLTIFPASAAATLDSVAGVKIGDYIEAIAQAKWGLQQIAKGMTFHEALGDAPMVDVTERRRSELERQIALNTAAIARWEATPPT